MLHDSGIPLIPVVPQQPQQREEQVDDVLHMPSQVSNAGVNGRQHLGSAPQNYAMSAQYFHVLHQDNLQLGCGQLEYR